MLTQWREYGGIGGGFSIGFDTDAMATMALRQGGLLRKVNYDEEGQKRFLTSALVRHCEVFDAHESAADAAFRCLRSWNVLCDNYSAYFKNHAFKSEQEWRLVYSRRVPARGKPVFSFWALPCYPIHERRV